MKEKKKTSFLKVENRGGKLKAIKKTTGRKEKRIGNEKTSLRINKNGLSWISLLKGIIKIGGKKEDM